jgi:hypothetical protein
VLGKRCRQSFIPTQTRDQKNASGGMNATSRSGERVFDMSSSLDGF